MGNDAVEGLAGRLGKEPCAKNWKAFCTAMKRGGIRRYRIVYAKDRFEGSDDLRGSYAELFSESGRRICAVPIFETDGKRLRGAMAYLKGLKIIR